MTAQAVSEDRINELLFVCLPNVKVHPDQLMIAWCEILRDTQNGLRELLSARERIAQMERHKCPEPWRVALPKITPNVLQQWDGAIALIEHTDEGPQWDGNAVDLACMLQETAHGAGSSDRPKPAEDNVALVEGLKTTHACLHPKMQCAACGETFSRQDGVQ